MNDINDIIGNKVEEMYSKIHNEEPQVPYEYKRDYEEYEKLHDFMSFIHFQNLTEIDLTQFARAEVVRPIEESIKKRVMKNKITIVYGEPKIGKTLAVTSALMDDPDFVYTKVTKPTILSCLDFSIYKDKLLIIDNAQLIISYSEDELKRIAEHVRAVVLIDRFQHLDTIQYTFKFPTSLRKENLNYGVDGLHDWIHNTFSVMGLEEIDASQMLLEILDNRRDSSYSIDRYLKADYYNGALLKCVVDNTESFYITTNDNVTYYSKALLERRNLYNKLLEISKIVNPMSVEERILYINDGIVNVKAFNGLYYSFNIADDIYGKVYDIMKGMDYNG